MNTKKMMLLVALVFLAAGSAQARRHYYYGRPYWGWGWGVPIVTTPTVVTVDSDSSEVRRLRRENDALRNQERRESDAQHNRKIRRLHDLEVRLKKLDHKRVELEKKLDESNDSKQQEFLRESIAGITKNIELIQAEMDSLR